MGTAATAAADHEAAAGRAAVIDAAPCAILHVAAAPFVSHCVVVGVGVDVDVGAGAAPAAAAARNCLAGLHPFAAVETRH